jgi:hypothetical protein
LVPEGTADPDALACRMLLPGVEMTYAVENGASFRMIRVTELAEAGVEPETLHQFALRNLERSCSALVIEAREGEADGEELMLHFQTRDGLDAAPLLVAIPGRDTLFVVSAENPAATGWLTWRSRQEHRRQAYPLLPAPLRVSEHGVELA